MMDNINRHIIFVADASVAPPETHHHNIPTPLRLLGGLTHHVVWLVPLWGTPLESRQALSFYFSLYFFNYMSVFARSLAEEK